MVQCIFCKTTTNVIPYPADRDTSNRMKTNRILLCGSCDNKLSELVYNPLYKRFFLILKENRFSQNDLAAMFDMSKARVSQLLKKK